MAGPPPKAKPTVLGLPPVPFTKLYFFATPADLALVFGGGLTGLCSGLVLPLFSIVFGKGLDTFNSPTGAWRGKRGRRPSRPAALPASRTTISRVACVRHARRLSRA